MYPKHGARYHQGFYRPLNPKKYTGDINQIVYRSSYEAKFCHWADTNPGVLEWSSEETIIPYIKPTDNRQHRYYMDFKIKIRTKDGIETHLVEVKPAAQMVPPKCKQVIRGKLPLAWQTFLINDAKWDAAKRYASQRGYKFTILNEYDLGIKAKPKINKS